MQSEVPPASVGPRTTRYFSAPGLSSGPAGAAGAAAAAPPRPPLPPPPPPKLYTPERSGLPSEVRGTGLVAGAVAAAVTGAVPAAVTVTSRVSVVLLGPATVSV